jgi:hypothetical protein
MENYENARGNKAMAASSSVGSVLLFEYVLLASSFPRDVLFLCVATALISNLEDNASSQREVPYLN